MDKIRKGEISYHQEFVDRDSLLFQGVDIPGSFKKGEKIELARLLMLMLTTSDITASLWLQSIAGSGSRINMLLDSIGLVNTRVNSRTPGREQNNLPIHRGTRKMKAGSWHANCRTSSGTTTNPGANENPGSASMVNRKFFNRLYIAGWLISKPSFSTLAVS